MRKLSSRRWTFVLKYLLPLIFAFLWATEAYVLSSRIVEHGSFSLSSAKILSLSVLAFFTLVFLWRGVQLKHVRLSGNSLLIGGYRSEIEVNLSNVKVVTSNRSSIQLVWIRFLQPTRFGGSIVFAPEPNRKFSFLVHSHPLVEELNEMIRAARIAT